MPAEQLEKLLAISRNMHVAATKNNWKKLADLDSERLQTLEKMQNLQASDKSETSLGISREIFELDQKVLELTKQYLEDIALELSRGNDFSKVRDHYQQNMQ